MKALMNDVLLYFGFITSCLSFVLLQINFLTVCFSTRDGSLHIHLVEKTSEKSVDINIEVSG